MPARARRRGGSSSVRWCAPLIAVLRFQSSLVLLVRISVGPGVAALGSSVYGNVQNARRRLASSLPQAIGPPLGCVGAGGVAGEDRGRPVGDLVREGLRVLSSPASGVGLRLTVSGQRPVAGVSDDRRQQRAARVAAGGAYPGQSIRSASSAASRSMRPPRSRVWYSSPISPSHWTVRVCGSPISSSSTWWLA